MMFLPLYYLGFGSIQAYQPGLLRSPTNYLVHGPSELLWTLCYQLVGAILNHILFASRVQSILAFDLSCDISTDSGTDESIRLN